MSAAAAAAQVAVRTFSFTSPNQTQILCTDNSGNTNEHNHELVNLVELQDRFIADIAKDGPAWQDLLPILNRIYSPDFSKRNQTKVYYDQQLVEFTNIDSNDSNITPYPNIPKSSNNGNDLKVLEHHVNIVFNESGYGPDAVCKSHNPTVIYTPASLLDSCLTKGNRFWPSKQDNINIVFDNGFMQRMGFYGTRWEKNGDDIRITYTAIQGENPDVIIQPVTVNTTVDILQKDVSQPINGYMQGNATKNYYLSANVGNLGNNTILKECIKLIETKELGDFMQVLLYLAYIMIDRPTINNVSMITTDNVVFAACRKLRLPCLYTGCRLDVLSGHATFYKYTSGLINYLDKLISMITHRFTTILTHNSVTKVFLTDIHDNPTKCKFIVPDTKFRGPLDEPPRKIIEGFGYRPFDRRTNRDVSVGIERVNKADFKALINYINKTDKILTNIIGYFLNALTSSKSLIIDGTTYIELNSHAIIEAGQAHAAAAAAPTPAQAKAANDEINRIYDNFKELAKNYRVNQIITRIDNNTYTLCPGTRLFDIITERMGIDAEKSLQDIILKLQTSITDAYKKRDVKQQSRQSRAAAAARKEAIATAAALASFSAVAPTAFSAAPSSTFSFLAAPTASSSAPVLPPVLSAANAGPYAIHPLPPPAYNNAEMNGGAINFENDYKELMQCIDKEIENKDSELVTNLFLCYAFQLLITVQNVMEDGLTNSNKLFELAIKSTNPKDIKSLNELIVYNEFINSIHYYSIKDNKNSDASLYFGSYLLALDNEEHHYEFAIIYDNLISTIDSDTILHEYQIGEICGTNDNNILKYGKILKKYINFIDDNSIMMKNIEKSVAEMIKNSKKINTNAEKSVAEIYGTNDNNILKYGKYLQTYINFIDDNSIMMKNIEKSVAKMIKNPTTRPSINPIKGNSITGKTKAISNFKNHPPNSIGVRPLYKIPVGGSRKKHNRRKKIDTRKRQRKHKHKSRKHSHAAIRTSKARPASRRFR